VLVLLPPSEGKTAPARGAPLRLDALAFAAELTPAREEVLAALDPALRGRPAARAGEVYTGVLFQALDLPALPASARRRVLIFSGLWGVVRPGDRIPAYKLPIGAKLPGLPALARFWRPQLDAALPDRGLVVDLRSAPYAAAWAPRRSDVLTVRGFRPDGAAVTHMVKAVRGRVARILLEAPRPPRSAEQAAELVAAAGLPAELNGSSLDVTWS
jgi:cytoplasmic iron level regulating protein YaaA (DUF328/UPF0246 family)